MINIIQYESKNYFTVNLKLKIELTPTLGSANLVCVKSSLQTTLLNKISPCYKINIYEKCKIRTSPRSSTL
jgi:hypothetical protein